MKRNNNDLVSITCYGQKEIYKRQDAIKFFTNAIYACEGHERLRYEYIVECLKCGDTVIDDSEV